MGGDSGIIEHKNGWDAMYSAYAGYNGSHQNYETVGIYQNGGLLGISGVWYKNNFFTGFGEAMFRGGGRNGVAFNVGFRWALGKDKK